MVIDCHSHLGKDYYFGESTLKSYDEFCIRNGIDAGILMPMPWPVYEKEGNSVASLIWEHENYKLMHYYKISSNKNKKIKKEIFNNPYEIVNYLCLKEIAKTKTNVRIYFAPLVHGVLDDPNYVYKLLLKENVVAVKFHGFASGFYADDVNKDIIEVLKEANLPIILHTSVYNYDYGYGVDTKYWRNKCSPLNWADFLIKNGLKGVLNHGACLDLDTIRLVNKSDNIMIGIGPDLDISNDPFKVLISKERLFKEGYFNLLKKYVNPNKLLFDVDYNWNLDGNGNVDNGSIKRVRSVWNYSDSQKILSENAKAFYKKIS